MSARSRWPNAARWGWLDAKEAREAAREPRCVIRAPHRDPIVDAIVKEIERLEAVGDRFKLLQVHQLLIVCDTLPMGEAPIHPPGSKYEDDIPF